MSPVFGVKIYRNTKLLGESNGMGKVFVDSTLELSELKFYHPKYFNTKGVQAQSNVESISSGSQGFQNQLEFLRLSGNYEVFGAEFLAQKRVNQFIFWVNFSVMDNRYDV
ncbi:hypothetical protein [Psychroflexus sp. MES1-P1E]|uniref:hypothetical protein n=1 Tax=Psychroflexus sp. MES1-P1E TaxID=2058320 RepID=UPI002155D524|nr:hypothetical protein [Psychroflexus sp. MES1-P1E]